ncbi:MAG: PA0069 family radical SAM protein [Candidatus Binatia bacterium]
MEPVKRFPNRGTRGDPESRYERIHLEVDNDTGDGSSRLPTVFYRDTSRTVLARNDSPDVGFRFSLNPYRGCEHGCIYCYARPTHEYLSFSAGLDFERRILVKHDAPELLRQTFLSPRWQPALVALSGNTDCYQPIERHLQLTRRCLAVFREFLNPVGIVTKSALVTRDIDLLRALAGHGAAHVLVSITSLDGALAHRMEPRAATPERRLETVRGLSAAGVPVGVLVAPVIPGLNDEEIPRILRAAAAAGACSASWTLLRLPRPVDELFSHWLAEQFPARRQRVLGRIRQCRGGQLSDARFGRRMRGEGPYAEHIEALFRTAARRHHLDRPLPVLNASVFHRPRRTAEQCTLW